MMSMRHLRRLISGCKSMHAKGKNHGQKLHRDNSTFVDDVASYWYWIDAKKRWPSLFKLVWAYFSIPSAVSKSETAFSYSGSAITKQRNRLGVHLTEAMTVYNDFTRQEHYSFKKLLDEVKALGNEHELVKEEKGVRAPK